MTANLADLLFRAAAEAGDRTALVDTSSGRQMTWAELDDAVARVAHGLEELGLVAGNRVLIATANRPEFVVVYLAILRAHLVAVPVNARSATGELVRMLADCGARLLVADATTVDSARAVASGVGQALAGADRTVRARSTAPHILAVDCRAEPGEAELGALLHADRVPLLPTRDPESLAVLLYTSGSSARPRAAMLSHRALVANIEQCAEVQPPMIHPDDVVYGVLPLFHVYGLNGVLGQVLHHHATLVITEGFDPDRSLQEIEQHGVTVVPVAPVVLARWRDRDDLAERLGGVRMVLSGSAPLSPELADAFAGRSRVPVHQGYGLTEAAPAVTSTLCSRVPKPGSVGAALPGVSLRLVDETGQRPAGSDPGEIHVAGNNLFSGYWPDGGDGPVDGWFATGDVGFLDADGDLFLVDRLKELIVVSGFNVYPSEIEEVLSEVDGVEEAAVVGVPDEGTGEAVIAYVCTGDREGERAEELRDRIRSACDLRLARFKQPARVELVETLPHTDTGKIAKGRLRADLRRRQPRLLE